MPTLEKAPSAFRIATRSTEATAPAAESGKESDGPAWLRLRPTAPSRPETGRDRIRNHSFRCSHTAKMISDATFGDRRHRFFRRVPHMCSSAHAGYELSDRLWTAADKAAVHKFFLPYRLSERCGPRSGMLTRRDRRFFTAFRMTRKREVQRTAFGTAQQKEEPEPAERGLHCVQNGTTKEVFGPH